LAITKIRKKKSTNASLKRKNWYQYKASQLRSSWRGRAKKLGIDVLTVPTRKDIQAFLEGIGEETTCYLSGEPLKLKVAEFDHKIPTGRSGAFSLDNIGITSKQLNGVKGMMTHGEFLGLLALVSSWEDGGANLFKRLSMSNNLFRRRGR
jgi:hypothetical protein